MRVRPTVLLTGATGFLGRYLRLELQRRGVDVLAAGRGTEPPLDLDRPESIAALADRVEPQHVLHAAALASLAACAADPGHAQRVNAQAAARLAQAFGGRLLLVSTDLVFDGRSAPYEPEASTSPLSVYGRSKAAAESAAVAAGARVVRLPLLFGRSHDGRRGATDMIRRALADRAALVLYENEYRTPLHVADAARGLVDHLLAAPRRPIAHLAGRERIARAELGRRFLELHGLAPGTVTFGVGTDPARPRDVSLRTDWDCGRTLDAALRDA
jgi:dTDP-4-dehydrorhamnose reductase